MVLKAPRLAMRRSIISLSKITHQMWHNHSISQRNKATKRAGREGLGVCVCVCVCAWVCVVVVWGEAGSKRGLSNKCY